MELCQEHFRTRGQKADEIRILIVSGDEPLVEQIRTTFVEKGIASERVAGIAAARESVNTDGFPVVVVTPALHDGSWRRLVDFASSSDPTSFVVILVAETCSSQERVAALDYGAFDVLAIPDELPKLNESVMHAVWAAYLRGSCRWV